MDALELRKYKHNLEFYTKVTFWMSELVTLLEYLFPGQFSALKEDGKLQAHVSSRMTMEHLIATVSSVKEKGNNFVAIVNEIGKLTYTTEAVGSANFFKEQHRLQQAVTKLGFDLPDGHFMVVATTAFDECRHTEALVL